MEETLQALARDFNTISSGRAMPSLLDPVRVEVYGSIMPLNQCATVNTLDASNLSLQVWDKNNIGAVEKGILNSGLGLNPVIEGTLFRIPIPKPSEERRLELVKLAKKYTEDKKISLRNVRRTILEEFEKEFKDSVSEDDLHRFKDDIQKLTDNYNAKLDDALKQKEDDIRHI